MLGIAISERTVSRILRRLRRPPNQTWKAFLQNHVRQLVSIDFFTVPTITMRVLFVLIVLEHDRRKVLHFNVTEHPTGAWTAQQIVEAFAEREAAQYLIRDRDSRYSAEVGLRLIGSIRRECLNHYIIRNARHLKRTLSSYFRYYHQSRTHLSLDKQCPFPREVLEGGKDHRNSTTRPSSSPIRPHCGVTLSSRINYWRTTTYSDPNRNGGFATPVDHPFLVGIVFPGRPDRNHLGTHRTNQMSMERFPTRRKPARTSVNPGANTRSGWLTPSS